MGLNTCIIKTSKVWKEENVTASQNKQAMNNLYNGHATEKNKK